MASLSSLALGSLRTMLRADPKGAALGLAVGRADGLRSRHPPPTAGRRAVVAPPKFTVSRLSCHVSLAGVLTVAEISAGVGDRRLLWGHRTIRTQRPVPSHPRVLGERLRFSESSGSASCRRSWRGCCSPRSLGRPWGGSVRRRGVLVATLQGPLRALLSDPSLTWGQ